MKSAILGMGIISAIGKNMAETAANLYAEQPVLPSLPRRFDSTLALPIFELDWPVPDPDVPGNYTMQLLLVALQEALENAGITPEELAGKRIGCVIGTTVAAQLNDIPFHRTFKTEQRIEERPLRSYIFGNPSEYIRRKYALNGPALTVSNACTSGADAIGIAHLWLNSGLCDLVIAGGTDEVNQVPLDGFNAIGVCSPVPCAPFDAQRQGLNLGEAAGVLILGKENLPSEMAIAGFGKTSDAFHITQPEPEGTQLEEAIRHAVAACPEASLKEIAFINAHGTGTQANDAVEMKVFQRIFGEIPYMSTKGLTGHTLGAAGAIEAIFSAIMLKQEKAVRSTRFRNPPEGVTCLPLTEHRKLASPRFAISTSLAFGGSNTALLIQRRY